MRLKDRVAVITGGGRGIGKAVALGFAKEGADVVLAARSVDEITEARDEIIQLERRSSAIVCNVSDEDQVKNLIEETLNIHWIIDILVNNAGMRPVWGTSKANFERVLAVNLVGTFLCTKHVWKPMRAAEGGSIINISSLGGVEGYPLLSAYCASKWGQIGFTVTCAEEGKPDNTRVNAIAPGKADTALRAQIKEDKSNLLKPEDHVGVCVFLASDESEFITGQVIPIEWFGNRTRVG